MTDKGVTIRVVGSKKLVTFNFTDTTLTVLHNEPNHRTDITNRQVLAAYFDPDSKVLEVSYLTRKRTKDPLSLVRIEGEVQNVEISAVVDWVEALMQVAYEGGGVNRHRRFKVLVNPHGGVGKAIAVFSKTVEPIFRTARCVLDIIHTTHRGHAFEIAKALPLKYDAIITVSGDGIIHEVMNGFAQHEDPKKAFAIPISPIPTGSGNGLALNLLGIEHGFDVATAALNAIKGKPMKVDIFSVTQKGKRSISFMSQALGLMADLDLGTENLRWMGDTRFMVGLIRGLAQFKSCPVQLSIKVAEHDKTKMAEHLQARRMNEKDQTLPLSTSLEFSGGALPPLKFLPDENDGWTTFDEPVLYIYAGKGPYVGRDLMAFPVSLPDDGLIDIAVMPVSSRKDVLACLVGAERGDVYWHPKMYYVKAHAYRVKPITNKGVLSVDGEAFPFEDFQVEVHQGLATLLSPHGHYAANFEPRTTSKATNDTKVH